MLFLSTLYFSFLFFCCVTLVLFFFPDLQISELRHDRIAIECVVFQIFKKKRGGRRGGARSCSYLEKKKREEKKACGTVRCLHVKAILLFRYSCFFFFLFFFFLFSPVPHCPQSVRSFRLTSAAHPCRFLACLHGSASTFPTLVSLRRKVCRGGTRGVVERLRRAHESLRHFGLDAGLKTVKEVGGHGHERATAFN